MTGSLNDRLDREPAPGWRPEPGDKVIGTIVEISEAPGTDFGAYPLITIEQDDGTEIAVHAFHSVLRNELESKQPSEGDRIGIRYAGKVAGKSGGRDYESYRVVLERVTPRATDTPAPAASTPAPSVSNGATSPGIPATVPATPDWADEEPF